MCFQLVQLPLCPNHTRTASIRRLALPALLARPRGSNHSNSGGAANILRRQHGIMAAVWMPHHLTCRPLCCRGPTVCSLLASPAVCRLPTLPARLLVPWLTSGTSRHLLALTLSPWRAIPPLRLVTPHIPNDLQTGEPMPITPSLTSAGCFILKLYLHSALLSSVDG